MIDLVKKKSFLVFFSDMDCSMLEDNPWHVNDIDAFNFLCCPECVYRCKEENSFQSHAIWNHPKSKVLFSYKQGSEVNRT